MRQTHSGHGAPDHHAAVTGNGAAHGSGACSTWCGCHHDKVVRKQHTAPRSTSTGTTARRESRDQQSQIRGTPTASDPATQGPLWRHCSLLLAYSTLAGRETAHWPLCKMDLGGVAFSWNHEIAHVMNVPSSFTLPRMWYHYIITVISAWRREFATLRAAIPTLFSCRVQDRIEPCPSTWREVFLYAIVTVVRRPCYLFCGCRGTEGGDSPPSRRVRCGVRHAPVAMDHTGYTTPHLPTTRIPQHSIASSLLYGTPKQVSEPS